ncbi:phosphatase PAP2 family protein [Rhodoligotrophos defluvii]|uniref:phosphatase PAP2 family protein n=1 Tax=Rhodoligotrophos defluvii TaxID=2561934 RepID=UPI0010C9DCE6|nr:phosphatase PAP2 family protein [Rhodoligotrophos defluvii]
MTIENAPLWFTIGLILGLLLLHRLVLIILKIGQSRIPQVLKTGRQWRGYRWLKDSGVQLADRYPHTADFIARRLNLTRFSGLPLTLVVIAAVYVLILGGDLLQALLDAEDLVDIDRQVNEHLSVLRGPPVLGIFVFLTFYGTVPFMIGATVLVTVLLVSLQRGIYVIPLWLTIGCATALTWAGKYALARPRPEVSTTVIEASPSFPSGHATAAMAAYGFLAYVCSREGATLRVRFEVVFWSSVLIALMGFSRLVLGVHYLSDVAMGYLVGLFFLLIGVGLAEYLRKPASGKPSSAE